MNLLEFYPSDRKQASRIMNTVRRAVTGQAPKYKGKKYKTVYNAVRGSELNNQQLESLVAKSLYTYRKSIIII